MNTNKNNGSEILGIITLIMFLLFCVVAIALAIIFDASNKLVSISATITSILGVFFAAIGDSSRWKDKIKQWFTNVPFVIPHGKQVVLLVSLFFILSLGFNIVQAGIIFGPHGHAPIGPAQASAKLSPTVTATANSSLIPSHTEPTLSDPLNNASSPYQWDIGPQGGATCSFSQGGSYVIAAPKDTKGGECNTEANNSTLTNAKNFVYQVKMQIMAGLQGEGGTGPTFCVSSQFGGSFYAISIDAQGNWTFSILTGGATGPVKVKTILTGVNHSFIPGIGQANYITIRVKNHQIDAQVNGYPLFSTIDSQLNAGQIGIQLGPGTHDASVSFSNARVWVLS